MAIFYRKFFPIKPLKASNKRYFTSCECFISGKCYCDVCSLKKFSTHDCFRNETWKPLFQNPNLRWCCLSSFALVPEKMSEISWTFYRLVYPVSQLAWKAILLKNVHIYYILFIRFMCLAILFFWTWKIKMCPGACEMNNKQNNARHEGKIKNLLINGHTSWRW